MKLWYHIYQTAVKKAIFIAIIIVLLLIIQGLISSIYTLWNKQDLLTSAQQELRQEQLQNQKLNGELSYVKSGQFVEEEAHNKLFMSKPGEQEVLIAPSLIPQAQVKKQVQIIPNWQKWLNLFF